MLKPWMPTDSTYSKIDEEGSIALQDGGRSESQTQLHDGVQDQADLGKSALQVTRTLDLSVTTDGHSHSGSEREHSAWN